jgi:LmbE family N-acetylglucosaminyl deacetylase
VAQRPPSPLERILVVAAHPDDIDFGCSGSIATWTDEGIEVAYCIITDGDAGGSDRTQSRAEMAVVRREEQTAAAACVGVTDLTFLGHPDGRLESTLEVRRDISRVIRRVRPQRVVGPSPERNWQRIFASHPDHLAAGVATIAAVYPDARNPFAHPELLEEGLEPHTVEEVWMMAFPTPDTWIDVTDHFDRKIAALQCHRSQVGGWEDLPDAMREWGSAIAHQGGLADGRLAEAFRVISAV